MNDKNNLLQWTRRCYQDINSSLQKNIRNYTPTNYLEREKFGCKIDEDEFILLGDYSMLCDRFDLLGKEERFDNLYSQFCLIPNSVIRMRGKRVERGSLLPLSIYATLFDDDELLDDRSFYNYMTRQESVLMIKEYQEIKSRKVM